MPCDHLHDPRSEMCRECRRTLSHQQAIDQALARFLSYVNRTETCWLWTGATVRREGYAIFSYLNRCVSAHRWFYEQEKGLVPKHLTLDHLCRVRHCVNPDHLEIVTRGENVRRGLKGILTTHCPQGHPYDEANTYWSKVRINGRSCRRCHREREKRKRFAVST